MSVINEEDKLTFKVGGRRNSQRIYNALEFLNYIDELPKNKMYGIQKVKKEHYIYKNYFEWLKFGKDISKVFEELKKKVGLETNNFSPSERLIIIPTAKDLLEFANNFTKKEYPNGLRSFKKTSAIQKEWEKLLKENNIKILHKPNIVWDFNYGVGRFRTRLFHYKDDLYCSIETEHLGKEVPEGYEEIKGSLFYKIIEQIEEGEK